MCEHVVSQENYLIRHWLSFPIPCQIPIMQTLPKYTIVGACRHHFHLWMLYRIKPRDGFQQGATCDGYKNQWEMCTATRRFILSKYVYYTYIHTFFTKYIHIIYIYLYCIYIYIYCKNICILYSVIQIYCTPPNLLYKKSVSSWNRHQVASELPGVAPLMESLSRLSGDFGGDEDDVKTIPPHAINQHLTRNMLEMQGYYVLSKSTARFWFQELIQYIDVIALSMICTVTVCYIQE